VSDNAHILVVEDEPSILRGLCDVLAFRGYTPQGVERGDDGLRAGLENGPDLVILDIMLPGLDGFEVCRRLRAARPALPILMLTARGSEPDVLKGFRCGSDDYLTKPFSVSELLARVAALLRRSGQDVPGDATFRMGVWELDPARLRARNGEAEVELTRRELGILGLLARDAGRIVSRRQLLREVWGYPEPDRLETRTVDMHIAKLRKKFAAAGAALIETVRGEGYRFPG
jgi:two-component system response regulator RegX3